MNTNTRTGKPTRRRNRKRFGMLLAAALLSAGGWFAYHQPFAVEGPESDEKKIETAEAVEGAVAVTVESPAVAEPYRVRTLRAAVGGTVAWAAQEGDEVAAGQPLVRFAAAEFERSVALARISLTDAEIKRDRASADLAKAERVLREREALLVTGAVSREQVLSAREQATEAQYALRSAELAVERARIELETAEDELDGQIQRAPFDGTVLRLEMNEGDRVGQNSTLLSFGDLSRLRFRAEIDEYDIGRVAVGLPVSIRSDLLGDDNLRARVESISPEAEIVNNIPVFRVTATADNPEGRLKPGMSTDLVVQLARDSGIVIPAGAVSTVRTRSYVEVVKADETETRRVETGANDGANIVVLDGLQAGELVKLPDGAGVLPGAAPAEASQQPEAIPMSVPGSPAGGGTGGGAGSGGGGGGTR